MEGQNNFNRDDRDMLVILNTKVDQMGFDIKDMKDGLVTRVVRIEARLDAEDVYHAAIPLEHYKNNSAWVDDFRSNYKFILTLGGILLAVCGGIISRLAQKWFGF